MNISHLSSDASQIHSQENSPLFITLAPEIRDLIFAFTLAPYQVSDPGLQFNNDSFHKRPGYHAPFRSDTALLRTCRRIYSEAWFHSWTQTQQIFYVTAPIRRPKDDELESKIAKMQKALDVLYEMHGDVVLDEGIRIFAQLYLLEDGVDFGKVLQMKHFHPRSITVTLRHTDWWYWEQDVPMKIGSKWVEHHLLPASTQEVRMELESLERRKGQVDSIAEQMCKQWSLLRGDGTVLTADENEAPIERWTGSSTLVGKRWITDETPGKENVLDYYIRTVVFRPSREKIAIGEPPYRKCGDLSAPAIGKRTK